MVPVTSSNRSLTRLKCQRIPAERMIHVDFPWSMWAIIEKLRMYSVGFWKLSVATLAARTRREVVKLREGTMGIGEHRLTSQNELLVKFLGNWQVHLCRTNFINRHRRVTESQLAFAMKWPCVTLRSKNFGKIGIPWWPERCRSIRWISVNCNVYKFFSFNQTYAKSNVASYPSTNAAAKAAGISTTVFSISTTSYPYFVSPTPATFSSFPIFNLLRAILCYRGWLERSSDTTWWTWNKNHTRRERKIWTSEKSTVILLLLPL